MNENKVRIKVKPKKDVEDSNVLKIKPKICSNTSNVNLEYYVISSDFSPSLPLLEETFDVFDLLKQKNALDIESKIVFNLAKPSPINPTFGDHHSSPNSVVSQKLADIISSFNIDNIQMLPSVIVDDDGATYENYYLVHIYNYIDCLDKTRSIIEIDNSTKSTSIKKMRLSSMTLNKIDLPKRLIFKLEEIPHLKIYHKSIVDAITSSEITGLKFYTIKDWYDGMQFDSFLKNKTIHTF